MKQDRSVWLRKTTWVGIVAVLAGLTQALFPEPEGEFVFSFGALLGGLLNEKVLLGLGMIFGRMALATNAAEVAALAQTMKPQKERK